MTRIALGEVSLEVFQQGIGPTRVLLVHGYQASARIWHGVQQALPGERYTSVAVNNRGAGLSDAPPHESDYTLQKFADDLHALVDHLGWDSFVLVGHSMGGATVAQYAVDHPERVSHLVLVDPASPDGAPIEGQALEAFLDERMAQRRAQLARGGGGDGIDARGGAVDPAIAAQLVRDIEAAPERRLRGSMRSMMQLRLGPQVRSLPMPVLLVAGDQDRVIPLANMLASWAMYPPGSGLHVWHGVGHSPNFDHPQAMVALMRQFVEGLPAPG
jgi:pimeloyl-ACP methyl ester carboxylesterase